MSRSDRHAPYRQALARQVDEPLPEAERRDLETHLAACGPCRAVADAYAAQRGLLRALRAMEPPRDLWARTSTALDHELTRGAGRPRLVALGSLASLGLVLAVAAGAAGLGPFSQGRPGAATPFPVTPEPIAYLTSQGNQITIYQTQVSEVCPAPVAECGGPTPSSHPVISVDLTAALAPRDLTLGADGTLAITARDSSGNAVYSVLALPRSGSDPGATPTPWSPTGVPSATPQATRSAPATPTHGHVTSPPTKRPTSPPVTPPATPGAPAGQAGDGAQLEPILSDVIAAGAPAAWSPDGDILAFSARPADGSTGPDVYVWHLGDTSVHAVTTDHRSYFASWAGDRIVISRLPAGASAAAHASPSRTSRATHTAGATATVAQPQAVTAATLLLDPASGTVSPVALSDAWLPSVDPTGHLAIYWRGTLMAEGTVVEPTTGALYLIDWAGLTGIPPTSLAPAAATSQPSGSATAEPSAPASPATSSPDAMPAESSVRPSAAPIDDQGQGQPTPPLTGATGAPRASATPGVAGSAAADGATGIPTASGGSATDGSTVVAPRLLAATGTEVTDWLVRWTPDGQTYGVWTAAHPGADVGLLLVASTGGAATSDPLRPTSALRAFSLGEGRVAWIAPDATAQSGDLQIVTWGADGAGGIRIRVLGGATLAF